MSEFCVEFFETSANGVFWGVSSVQRVGHFNTSLRVLGSHALGEKSAAASTGYLLFTEVSRTLAWTSDCK